MNNDNDFVSIGEAAILIGVSVPTLRRWEKLGKFVSSFRTFGNHRRYKRIDVLSLFNKEKKIHVAYARVSSHDQKDDLKRLLTLLLCGKIDTLHLTHKDRLLRFGSELIFNIAQQFGTKIVLIYNENSTFEEQLAKDVLEIITVFSAKLYGSRSHKNKKKKLE